MIKINNLNKTYNYGKQDAFKALYDIDLKISDGEFVAIIGTSGAGKSMLLHILACIDDYEEGEYYIDDVLVKNMNEKELAKIRNKKIGMVMQDFALIDDLTAIQNIMLPLDFGGVKGKEKQGKAKTALSLVGMEKFSDKRSNKLSGGQKQRVAIARAIVNDSSIILADEPTGALDSKTSAEIMDVFKELNESGRTIIIVTHDLDVAKQCRRIIEISDGKIISDSKNG